MRQLLNQQEIHLSNIDLVCPRMNTQSLLTRKGGPQVDRLYPVFDA